MGKSDEELVDLVFDAFSNRSKPRRGFWMVEEAELVERHLDGVRPRELSFDVLESSGESGRSFLPSMKLPMQLHYVPSFMALYIADRRRVDFVESEILSWFRDGNIGYALSHFQDTEAIAGWILAQRPVVRRKFSRRETLAAAGRVRRWYWEGFRPVDNRYLAVLTEREKRAFLCFFARLEDEHSREFGPREGIMGRAIFAAQAMLRGEALPKRLGAKARDECVRLIELLDVMGRRFRKLFPKSETRPLREALERDVRNWRGD